MLCNALPLPYDYSGLLCETLFAQLLRLPGPRLCPLAFSGLIAHAALLRPAFPKYLAGSVRQLFLRVEYLAPELVGRLAEVLAHFITNMGFRWVDGGGVFSGVRRRRGIGGGDRGGWWGWGQLAG